MSVKIFEVHVDPINEDDLPSAELLTQVFGDLRSAIFYARSLCHSTTFNQNEIIITQHFSNTLKDFKYIEREVKHGK